MPQRPMPSKRRTWTLLVTLAGILALALWTRRLANTPVDDLGAAPQGWWRMAAGDIDRRSEEGVRAVTEVEGEDLARQLSLPYAAGVVRAAGRFGVRAWDPARTARGVNLYVSGHAAEAVLIAMDGKVLHRWRCPFERAFPGRPAAVDSFFFRRAALLANGDLVAIYQGGGIVRLAADSKVVWARPGTPFNDLWVSPGEDRILFIEKLALTRSDLRGGEPVLEDWIVTLDGGGLERERASLLAAFERSSFRSLLAPLGETADILHTNTIAVLSGVAIPDSPFRDGDWLVSLREVDIVAVLAAGGREVRWAQRGPFHRQHEPSLLPDGRMLLFDNQGGSAGRSRRSRVVALDPRVSSIETLWPPPGMTFSSQQMGTVARLENGNLLAIESERGAAFEITPAGDVVWEFRSPHRAGPRGELVAVLADLVRLRVATPFLERVAKLAPIPPGAGAQAP